MTFVAFHPDATLDGATLFEHPEAFREKLVHALEHGMNAKQTRTTRSYRVRTRGGCARGALLIGFTDGLFDRAVIVRP